MKKEREKEKEETDEGGRGRNDGQRGRIIQMRNAREEKAKKRGEEAGKGWRWREVEVLCR